MVCLRCGQKQAKCHEIRYVDGTSTFECNRCGSDKLEVSGEFIDKEATKIETNGYDKIKPTKYV